MGFLVKPEKALVWRGPMVMAAVNKLAHETHWDPLDILVIGKVNFVKIIFMLYKSVQTILQNIRSSMFNFIF